jgi:WD40 repeat protein
MRKTVVLAICLVAALVAGCKEVDVTQVEVTMTQFPELPVEIMPSLNLQLAIADQSITAVAAGGDDLIAVATGSSLAVYQLKHLNGRFSLQELWLIPLASRGVASDVFMRVEALDFSPDGQTLASGMTVTSGDTSLVLWDTSTGEIFHHQPAGISSLDFSSDGQLLVLTVYDAVTDLGLFDVELRALSPLASTSTGVMHDLSLSPDSAQIAAASADDNAYLWSDSPQSEPINLPGHGPSGDGTPLAGEGYDAAQGVNAVAWSPDGTMIATGERDGYLTLWDVETASRIAEFQTAQSEEIQALIWHNNEMWLLVASGAKVEVFNTATKQYISHLIGHENSQKVICSGCMAWLSERNIVVAGGSDGVLLVWQLPTR